MTIHLNNPDWFQLRVTNAYIYDNIERAPEWKQKVAYVSVAGSNSVDKKNVEYEDENKIVYTDLDSNLSDNSNSNKEYVLFDKETNNCKVITKEEFTSIKKNKK